MGPSEFNLGLSCHADPEANPGSSARGSVRSFDKDNVGATIVGSDAHGFVEKAMEAFDANSFVVARSNDMNVNVEGWSRLLGRNL
jgi:hypothetical protein